MALSVSTAAPTTRLTTPLRVQEDMGLAAGTDDAVFRALIDAKSAAIANYCHRSFAREHMTETLGGFGGIRLQLQRTPVVSVTAVYRETDVITDATIEDSDRGWLYRRAGWAWTTQVWPGLSMSGAFLDWGTPIPRQEEPQFSVEYTAGYILPEQFLTCGSQVSVLASDSSFNSSAAFPALLRAGDVLVADGFVETGNAGRHIVSGTPTTSKIVVTSTLTDEAVGANKSIRFEPPAHCRPFADVERACIEAVKAGYIQRRDDPSIIEKQMGPARLRYSEQQDMLGLGLPSVCVGLLKPWVRTA